MFFTGMFSHVSISDSLTHLTLPPFSPLSLFSLPPLAHTPPFLVPSPGLGFGFHFGVSILPMASPAAGIPAGGGGDSGGSFLDTAFDDLEKQRELITNCTRLWKELSDHFSSLEKDLELKSESLRCKIKALDGSTQKAFDVLRRREQTIDFSVASAISRVEECKSAALKTILDPDLEDDSDLVVMLRSLCKKMDSQSFWDLVTAKRKEVEAVRSELVMALGDCIDPATFVMDAMSRVFPADQKAGKCGANDFGWACLLILEALVQVLADPELGSLRPLVTPVIRERAKRIVEKWKEGLEQRGGIEVAKPPDVHTFLQHVVTFDIVTMEDKELYRKLVMSSSWRRQMPKLALSLGLGDIMTDIIEELISKGQQLDAVNFAYEACLVEKFPPVPLLKSYIEDSKKAAATILEDRNNSSRAVNLAGRKEQSALRAVKKCIEDHNLQSEFPPDSLKSQIENLEKAKVEKKRPAAQPANKRTRANNGGPMPPAKAGRLTNHSHVPSFSAPPPFVRSPSHSPYHQATFPQYVYQRPSLPVPYGSQSPPAIRDHYQHRHEEMAPAPLGMAYSGSPVNYPIYARYTNGFAQGYQKASYYH